MLIRSMRALVIAAFFLFVVGPNRRAQAQTCSTMATQRDAAAVERLRNSLASLKTNSDDLGEDVPVGAQHDITALKHALVQSARDVAACAGANTAPHTIQDSLASLLRANARQPQPGTAVTNNDPRYTEAVLFGYGHNLLVEVTSLSSTLLAIKLSFHLECDSDSILTIFERSNGHWAERLTWQSPPYSQIREAFGPPLEVRLLDGATPGSWRVAVLHGTAQCVSVWSAFGLDVLAPTEDPSAPQVIAHVHHGWNLDEDDFFKFETKGDTITVRAKSAALDTSQLVRPTILRWQLRDNRLVRIQPLAINGRYFVDEWLNTPWSDAQRFSDPDHQAELRAAHQQIQQRTEFGYGPVRACTDSPERFQVELDDDGNNATFFAIRHISNGYLMVRAGYTVPDSACTGPDLMRKRGN